MTSRGLRIEIPLCSALKFVPKLVSSILQWDHQEPPNPMLQCHHEDDFLHVLGIPLRQVLPSSKEEFIRFPKTMPIPIQQGCWKSAPMKVIYIKNYQTSLPDTSQMRRILIRTFPTQGTGYRFAAACPQSNWDSRKRVISTHVNEHVSPRWISAILFQNKDAHNFVILFGFSRPWLKYKIAQWCGKILRFYIGFLFMILGHLNHLFLFLYRERNFQFSWLDRLSSLGDTIRIGAYCQVTPLNPADQPLHELLQTDIPFWPRTNAKLERHRVTVSLKEDVVMGEAMFIADIHLYPADEYRESNKRRFEVLSLLSLALFEWKLLRSLSVSVSIILLLYAVPLAKLNWNYRFLPQQLLQVWAFLQGLSIPYIIILSTSSSVILSLCTASLAKLNWNYHFLLQHLLWMSATQLGLLVSLGIILLLYAPAIAAINRHYDFFLRHLLLMWTFRRVLSASLRTTLLLYRAPHAELDWKYSFLSHFFLLPATVPMVLTWLVLLSIILSHSAVLTELVWGLSLLLQCPLLRRGFPDVHLFLVFSIVGCLFAIYLANLLGLGWVLKIAITLLSILKVLMEDSTFST